jgi:hypothetical protein
MKLSPNDRHCHPEPAQGSEGLRKQCATFLVRRDRKPLVRFFAALRMRI